MKDATSYQTEETSLSDEKNCQILVLEEGYNMAVPPVEAKDPVIVNVSIDVLKLPKMTTQLKSSMRSV